MRIRSNDLILSHVAVQHGAFEQSLNVSEHLPDESVGSVWPNLRIAGQEQAHRQTVGNPKGEANDGNVPLLIAPKY